MKIVYAPDAFHGLLSAKKIVNILEAEGRKFFPDCQVVAVPVSDGDEGVLDVLCPLMKGELRSVLVHNYLGEDTDVTYGIVGTDTMILETSLFLFEEDRMDVPVRRKLLYSTSSGVGELILHGLDQGCRHFYVGVGRSLAFDGGMGCAAVLGARFLDESGYELEPWGASLPHVRDIDLSGIDPRLNESEITVMCSVNNNLTGSEGAAYVYGALYGGGPDELIYLEKGMKNYQKVLSAKTGIDLQEVQGLGAAGGLPAGLLAFCDGKIRSGVSTIMNLIQFEKILEDAGLVIVGEEKLNRNTMYGKAISGISMLCKARKIPVIALAGQIDPGAEALYHYGVTSMLSFTRRCMNEGMLIEMAEELLIHTADNMFRLLITGMRMQRREDWISTAILPTGWESDKETDAIHWAVSPDEE